MFGLSLVRLFIYGALILAVIATAWWAWDHYIKDPYIEEGRAEIRPQLAASQQAEREREAETKQCAAATKVQSDAIMAVKKQAEAAQLVSAALIAKAQADAKAHQQRNTELRKLAAAAPKVQACEKELAEADVIVVESLKAGRK